MSKGPVGFRCRDRARIMASSLPCNADLSGPFVCPHEKISLCQVLKIREDSHIYFTNDGRISMAGITTANVEYVAKSIFAVTG